MAKTKNRPAPRLILWDIGGVVLTNAWDHEQRREAVAMFQLDPEAFEAAHSANFEAMETGRLSLGDYLQRVVFNQPRRFTPDDFRRTMFEFSRPLHGMFQLLADLTVPRGIAMATLNNEGRELNEYRVAKFGLTRFFQAFCTSCYLGVRKPAAEAWRRALGILQCPPPECVYIDDRGENAAAAAALGLDSIQFESETQLRGQLVLRGLL